MSAVNKYIPRYLLGSAYTVTITPQSVSAGGVFSDLSVGSMNFYGRIDDDQFEHSLNTQDFASVQSFHSNPVPMSYDAQYTITEIMGVGDLITASGQGIVCRANILESALRQSWYHKIVVVADDYYPVVNQLAAPYTPTPIFTYTFYALMTGLRRTSPKGKNTMTGTFKLCAVSDGLGGWAQNPALS